MTNVHIIPELITPLAFLDFQIPHYKERLAAARAEQKTIEEIAFLRKNLYNLKKQHQSFYN